MSINAPDLFAVSDGFKVFYGSIAQNQEKAIVRFFGECLSAMSDPPKNITVIHYAAVAKTTINNPDVLLDSASKLLLDKYEKQHGDNDD